MKDRPNTYITVYMPIAGWKAVMLAVDEDCGGMHTPWTTDCVAYSTKAAAVKAGKRWAEDEGYEFFDDCPNKSDDAPDKSVVEQLTSIFPGMKVVNLGG